MFAAQNDSAASLDFHSTLYRPCGIGGKYLGDPNDPRSVCYADTPPDSCHGYQATLGECNCKNCSRSDILQAPPTCYNGTIVRKQQLSWLHVVISFINITDW